MPVIPLVRRAVWPAIALLLLFWVSRAAHLLALPLFLDEAAHLTRAQWVWEGQPFYLLETGKALAPYGAALFWPFAGAPFIGRYVVVLIGAVGLASAYAVGRALHSRGAGLLVMALWVVCPQLFFYERMALVDTTISAMAMLALWLAIRMVRGGRAFSAMLCGVALALTVFAKLTGLVFLCIPVLVALLVPGVGWRARFRQIVIAYAMCGLILFAPLLYVLSTDSDPTGLEYGLTSIDVRSLPERLAANAADAWAALRTYFTDPLLALFVLAALVGLLRLPRRALLVLLLAAAPLAGVLPTAVSLWLRYLSPATPFLLLAVAFGAVAIRSIRPIRAGVALVVIGCAALVGVPFMLTAYTRPADLPLPANDRSEYIRWIPSGYGIREATDYLRAIAQEAPIVVIGTAVNCQSARLYLHGSAARLECPALDWGGRDYRHIQVLMRAELERNGVIYVLGEDKPTPTMPPEKFPGVRQLLATFPRPNGRYAVRVFRLSARTD